MRTAWSRSRRLPTLVAAGASLLAVACGGSSRPGGPVPAQGAAGPAAAGAQASKAAPERDARRGRLAPHWKAGNELDEFYRLDVDTVVFHGGAASGKVHSRSPKAEGMGMLAQMIRADAFRGKRVRVSAWVRTQDVRQWASLTVDVRGANRILDQARPRDGLLRATTGWVQQEIVVDVPPEAVGVIVALTLAGPGEAWIDDVAVEPTDESVLPMGRGRPGPVMSRQWLQRSWGWWGPVGQLPERLENPGLELASAP